MKRDADETMRRLATVFPLSRRRVAATWLAGCALHPAVMLALGAPGHHVIVGAGLVAVLTGAVIAATAMLLDRVEATTCRADDLRDLARIAASATELESGVDAGQPQILRLSGAESLHLRWGSGDEVDWVRLPDREVLSLGVSRRGPVSLVLDGVSDPSAIDPLIDLLGQLCERDRYIDELTRNSHTDPLTGLPNRRVLDRLLDQHDGNGPRSLILIGLQEVAEVNERRGRLAGDALIHRFGSVLSERARPDHTVCRVDGAEFCVLLSGGAAEARAVVDDIHRAWTVVEPSVTFAAGIADDDPVGGEEPDRAERRRRGEDLMARADADRRLGERTAQVQ